MTDTYKPTIMFMGTPDFARVQLEALCGAGYEIKAVITQPDKPKGRGKRLAMSPVKEYALEKGLAVYQPSTLRGDEFAALLREADPEMIVVAAFGKILPDSVLSYPKYGCVNVHGSLLPKYRGAAPIQRAIMDGEPETGITTMLMDSGVDTGDILLKESVKITPVAASNDRGDRLRRREAGKAGLVICDLRREDREGGLRDRLHAPRRYAGK